MKRRSYRGWIGFRGDADARTRRIHADGTRPTGQQWQIAIYCYPNG